MSISQQLPDNIKRACRAIGYAAWQDTTDGYMGLTVVLEARLEPHQRAALAYAALKSLDSEAAHATAAAAMGCAGQPIAPLFNPMDEAAFWADMATGEELEAYCLASFNRMSPGRQAAFLYFVQRRAAA